jgi:hypothetical protein
MRAVITITVRHEQDGRRYAWIETRAPGGWWVNRRLAFAQLRRQYPEAKRLDLAEEWHVPFRHRVFKVYFDA